MPKITSHKSKLPLWVKCKTSHLMKKTSNSQATSINKNRPGKTNKDQENGNEVHKTLVEDQTEFDETIFQGMKFSDFQTYKRSIHIID